MITWFNFITATETKRSGRWLIPRRRRRINLIAYRLWLLKKIFKKSWFALICEMFWEFLVLQELFELKVTGRVVLKVGQSASKKFGFIYFNESPLKMMKNAFYFMLKLCSFLRYLHYCPDFLVMQKKGLIRKLWLISKFMTP